MSSHRREPAELAALLARKASDDATFALVNEVGSWAGAQLSAAAEDGESGDEEGS